MPATITDALNQPNINLVRADLRRSVFKIKLGTLKAVITFRMYFDDDTRHWWVEQSHAIHTPGQAGPYPSGTRSDADRAWLLMNAIGALSMYYAKAKEAGHQPREDWLVPRRKTKSKRRSDRPRRQKR